MLEVVASPQIIGLLVAAFLLIAAICLCAHLLERGKKRKKMHSGR